MTKEHEPTHANQPIPVRTRVLDHEAVHGKPKPTQINTIARGVGHWNLTTGNPISLGDVDRRETHKFPIYYLGSGSHGPRIDQVRLTGDPAIRLLHAPMVLPAASQPYSELNQFKVDFDPHRVGRFESMLEFVVRESPSEQHRVAVIGEAHVPGEPTRKEDEEASRRQGVADREQREKARKAKEADDRLDKHNQTDHHRHGPAMADFGRANAKLARRFGDLLAIRTSGVHAAQGEVQNFKRKPPHNSTLLLDLAMAAMQVATAGISALVAKRLEPVVGMLLERMQHRDAEKTMWNMLPAREHFVSFFSESIESAVQTAGGAAISKLAPSPGGLSDPTIDFFQAERDSLVKSSSAAADETVAKVGRSLEPAFEGPAGMKTRPKGADDAIALVNKTADEIGTQVDEASRIQRHESVKHWVKYVADASMAGRNPSQSRNIGENYDGLIDLTFHATQANAEAPVSVTHARFVGVKRAVVARFLKMPLSQTGLAVRASCRFSPEQAVLVMKRPSSNLEYVDTPESVGSWLAKRAGVHGRASDGDQARGAKQLFDELARKSLEDHLTGRLPTHDAADFVENDSDE